MKSIEILELTWEMEDGSGRDDSLDNPLARAVDCLFRHGRPFLRLSKCFFRGPDGVIRWLGIFVHSAGDRVLFFPGFECPQTHIVGYNDQELRWDQPFKIDHLSLEADRLSWHFTEPQSADHLGKLYTKRLDSERLHWFSMSTATQQDLRFVRKETIVSAPMPPNDIDRRARIFRQSREGAVFQLVELNAEYPEPPEPYFLHFSVVLGRRGFPSPTNELLGDPFCGPFTDPGPPGASNDVPLRTHRILLSDDIELEVTASALPGHLKTSTVFSGPMESEASLRARNRR